MVPCAPRYRQLILDAIEALDERTLPIAEVNRRVGRVASEHGLPRPSYVHLRRLVRIKRVREDVALARRRALRALADGTVADVAAGRYVSVYDVAARVADINARAESGVLVAQSHKHLARYSEPP